MGFEKRNDDENRYNFASGEKQPSNRNVPSGPKPGDDDDSNVNKVVRTALIWLGIMGCVIFIYVVVDGGQKDEWPVSYTEYKEFLNAGLIDSAVVKIAQLNDYEFHGTLSQEQTITRGGQQHTIKHFITKLGTVDNDTETSWEQHGITWTYEEGDSIFWGTILTILPWVAIIAIWILIMRRMQNGGSKGIFSFGKSRARLISDGAKRITFHDVAGADEAKYELEEIIEFLRDPSKFQRLGGKIPRGVLLLGPPGTGKTLLARAVAGEANVPFFSISGADFVEMFVGVGASRVRDLFDQAKKNSPCIVFIDEIDAVGRHRGAGLGGGHDEREQTLNQLLVEMDGFEQNSGIIIIAATNRPDVLDPALLRPGRFDRQVVVDRPDVKGREGILKVHARNVPLSKSVDLAVIARGTPGLSGADLANLINESALLAARRNREEVTMGDIENAKDKILMGVERKSMMITEEEKEITAYHEMGHALAAKFLPNCDPVHKVTIIPRGHALGVTSLLPKEDIHTETKEKIESRITMVLAGRAAEMLVFKRLTSGALSDLKAATYWARKMVCELGMSDKLGHVYLAEKGEEVFLARELSHPRAISEETAQLIDQEIRRIVSESMQHAENLLSEHMDLLHKSSKILLTREVIDGAELDMIANGEELPPVSRLSSVPEKELAPNDASAVESSPDKNGTIEGERLRVGSKSNSGAEKQAQQQPATERRSDPKTGPAGDPS